MTRNLSFNGVVNVVGSDSLWDNSKKISVSVSVGACKQKKKTCGSILLA